MTEKGIFMHFISLNKLLKKPLYIQIADAIIQAYDNNVLKAGDLLPTENELCETFQVSTSVVKNAYQILIDQGLVRREMGRGTFINPIPPFRIDIHDAFWLFDQPNVFKRRFNYFESSTNERDVGKPIGPLWTVREVLYRIHHPVALRTLHMKQEFKEAFLDEGWNSNVRLNIKLKQFSKVTSTMQVSNLKDSEASLLRLNSMGPTFIHTVHFSDDETLIGVLDSVYPADHFIWEESLEPITFN